MFYLSNESSFGAQLYLSYQSREETEFSGTQLGWKALALRLRLRHLQKHFARKKQMLLQQNCVVKMWIVVPIDLSNESLWCATVTVLQTEFSGTQRGGVTAKSETAPKRFSHLASIAALWKKTVLWDAVLTMSDGTLNHFEIHMHTLKESQVLASAKALILVDFAPASTYSDALDGGLTLFQISAPSFSCKN